jgi:hypothetical protein
LYIISYLHELVVFFGGGEESREDAQLGQQLPLVLGLALLAVLQAARCKRKRRREEERTSVEAHKESKTEEDMGLRRCDLRVPTERMEQKTTKTRRSSISRL